MNDIYHWIGLTFVVVCFVLGLTAIPIFAYAYLIADRFNLIFFRKGERRISIASWYSAKLIQDDHYHADDFPIGERPFYLSYRVGQRRAFIMLGTIGPSRHMAISGKHPDEAFN